MDEVLRWFEETGFSFVSCLPRVTGDDLMPAYVDMFQPSSPGTQFQRLKVQIKLMRKMDAEGVFLP